MKLRFVSDTLFGRTALAFSLAFLLFSLFSLALVLYFVSMPLTQRVANDLSALTVLTAQIWVELPPGTRPDFEREMQEHHNLIVAPAGASLPADPEPAFYLRDFLQSLNERLEGDYQVLYDGRRPQWRWVDVPMGGRIMRVGFDTRRFITRIPQALILMVVAGTLIAALTSLLIMRRITRPLAALASATTRIGEGRRGAPLPEEGAAELRELSRRFNTMEQQLQVLMESRTTLLAGISHDLRTPIARMQLELELLEDNPDKGLIEGMRGDLGEMNEIISATLQLSQGIADETTRESELDGVIESVVDEFRRRGAEIERRGDAGIRRDLPVTAFRRVLGNLIDNAVRYGEGKPVAVSCVAEGEGVRIEIIDRGPGIPPDLRAIVLQPFKRLEDSRSRDSGGSGLGLAIVDQLCRINGWRFELDESEEGGVVARLRLS